MVVSHKTVTPFLSIAVYIASMICGGLHHHALELRPSSSNSCLVTGDSPVDTAAADSDNCALCAAIQLAKAPPPQTVKLVCGTITVEEVSCSAPIPRFLTCTPAHARAPPIL
jgi:hypothetical protein